MKSTLFTLLLFIAISNSILSQKDRSFELDYKWDHVSQYNFGLDNISSETDVPSISYIKTNAEGEGIFLLGLGPNSFEFSINRTLKTAGCNIFWLKDKDQGDHVAELYSDKYRYTRLVLKENNSKNKLILTNTWYSENDLEASASSASGKSSDDEPARFRNLDKTMKEIFKNSNEGKIQDISYTPVSKENNSNYSSSSYHGDDTYRNSHGSKRDPPTLVEKILGSIFIVIMLLSLLLKIFK